MFFSTFITVVSSLILVIQAITSDAGTCRHDVTTVVDRSALEAGRHQESDPTETPSADTELTGLELALEALPEYYTATAERKVIGRYLQVLEKRRLAALLDCETKLWEATQDRARPTKGGIQISSDSTDAPNTKYVTQVYEGRTAIDDIEASLTKCIIEMGWIDPEEQSRLELMGEISRIVDQIEACQAAGGESPFSGRTLAKLDKIKKQSNKATATLELVAVLESYVVRLALDKQSCFDSLALPANLHRYLK